MTLTSDRKAKVTLPADDQILITREFDAPRHLVYKALTNPELVKRWFHANRGVVKSVEIDLRVGGKWRYVSEADSIGEIGFRGEYRELVPHRSIRYSDKFDDAKLPGEMETTVSMTEVSCGTGLNIVQEGIPEPIPVEMCYLGWQESLAQLATLVETVIPD